MVYSFGGKMEVNWTRGLTVEVVRFVWVLFF